MESWLKLSLLLCVFGFLKELRPSEPFITPYFMEVKNLTKTVVNQDIYAVGTYSLLPQMAVVFLITDFLRYKPVILLEGFSAIVTWCLLVWGDSVPLLQAAEVFYSTFTATEVAYYTYMYAKVDKEHFAKVTGNTRTAYLLGRAASGVLSQLLVKYRLMNLLELNYITLATETLATIWAIALPSVATSMYFHRRDAAKNTDQENKSQKVKPAQAFRFMLKDIKAAYTDPYVVKWSAWWALSTCGYMQALNYTQVLWSVILPQGSEEWNGAVEAIYTLLGALATFSCGRVSIKWDSLAEVFVAVCAILQGGSHLVAAVTTSIWVAYLCHILVGSLYHASMTVANYEVAKRISEDSYGLIFGVNNFVGLLLQTILTAIVVDKGGLHMDIRPQFLVYGSYYVIIGAVFIFLALFYFFVRSRKGDVEVNKSADESSVTKY